MLRKKPKIERFDMRLPPDLLLSLRKLIKRKRELTKVKVTKSGEVREAIREYIRRENLELSKAEKGSFHAKPRKLLLKG